MQKHAGYHVKGNDVFGWLSSARPAAHCEPFLPSVYGSSCLRSLDPRLELSQFREGSFVI